MPFAAADAAYSGIYNKEINFAFMHTVYLRTFSVQTKKISSVLHKNCPECVMNEVNYWMLILLLINAKYSRVEAFNINLMCPTWKG